MLRKVISQQKEMISKSEAWTSLGLLAKKAKIVGIEIKNLFSTEANRLANFSYKLGNFNIDMSKTDVTKEVQSELNKLVKDAELERHREEMFTGAIVNNTEGRAVLHVALRNVEFKDGQFYSLGEIKFEGIDVMPDVVKELNNMAAFTDKVRAGEWKGTTGIPIKNIVSIGIGGSDLGPRLAVDALGPEYGQADINVEYVSNVDPQDIGDVIKKYDPETTMFIIKSKSFTTKETIDNATEARSAFIESMGTLGIAAKDIDIAKHFVAVSTEAGLVEKFGMDTDNMFGFWNWVGGRYSLPSSIGLSVMMKIGKENYADFLSGYQEVDDHYKNTPTEKNIPVQMALQTIWNNNFNDRQTTAQLPYSKRLKLLPAYNQQLNMESNGKSVTKEGDRVDYKTGPIVFGTAGTDGQHSYYQLFHQGTTKVPATFIGFTESLDPHGTQHQTLISNMLAQAEALMNGLSSEEIRAQGESEELIPHKTFEGNRPSNTILVEGALTPKALGSLIALEEHKVHAEGVILNINSFDQEGVQLGKKNATKIDEEFSAGKIGQHDPSTEALMKRAMTNNFINPSQHLGDNVNKIFKGGSYDIRAKVQGEDGEFYTDGAILTPEVAQAAGTLMGSLPFKDAEGNIVQLNIGDKVTVGRDNGPTSQVLLESFSNGLKSQGVDAYDVGIASSGQVYQNQYQLETQAHIQITRSHVEVDINGLKFAIGLQGIHTFLLGQMNQAVKDNAEIRNLPIEQQGVTVDKAEEGFMLYCEKMERIYGKYFANRDNSEMVVNLFGGTGLQYENLYNRILGDEADIIGQDAEVNSGKVLADPTRVEQLLKVTGLKDALIAGKRVHSFDLDADRGSVTKTTDIADLEKTNAGHYLGDAQAFMLSEYKLQHQVPALEATLAELKVPQENIDKIIDLAKLVYTDGRYTSGVKDRVEDMGGKTKKHCKGHSLWKETMVKSMKDMANLAGFGDDIGKFARATGYRDIQIEASLHLFVTDVEDGIPRDDAVENVFILEQVMDKLEIKDLNAYFDAIPESKRCKTKEIRTPSISNEVKEQITSYIMDQINSTFGGNKDFEITVFEGQIIVDFPGGFIMYGQSNTSPKLTFMVEGKDTDLRNNALAYIQGLHNDAKAKFGDPVPMDLKENPFYEKDSKFGMPNPDEIKSDDPRAKQFLKDLGL